MRFFTPAAEEQQKIDQILSQFPGPVTLHPSRRKWVGYAIGSLAFFAIGVWLINRPDPTMYHLIMSWTGIIMCGLLFVSFCVQLLPGARLLVLDRDHFETVSYYRRHAYSWPSAGPFTIYEFKRPGVPRVAHVLFETPFRRSGLSKLMLGRNASVPDVSGLSAEALVELMTRWRERALQG